MMEIGTWEVESRKVMTGSDWQMGAASMIRNMMSALEIMEHQVIAEHIPFTTSLAQRREWLTACLYSCNMENFKAK
jgi:hypothetical protein